MRKKSILFALTVTAVIAVTILTGSKEGMFWGFPIITSAEQSSETQQNENLQVETVFDDINQLAKDYKANPSSAKAKQITEMVFDNLSVLEIPAGEKNQIINQVANAHFNGSSNIRESNVVAVLNNLATTANAPDYAYASAEQAEVTRKYLNRLVPDLVTANGAMNDIEAFAVFAGLLSQKLDNEDFMVTPSVFAARMNNLNDDQIPGIPVDNGTVEVVQDSPQIDAMIGAVNSYVNSKNRLSSSDIITMIGIQ